MGCRPTMELAESGRTAELPWGSLDCPKTAGGPAAHITGDERVPYGARGAACKESRPAAESASGCFQLKGPAIEPLRRFGD